MTQLGDGAEFDLIRAMIERWGDCAAGIGDDAALVAMPRGERLVASVDASVEGRHYLRAWLSPREIGYRAVTAALSDLAAMAARPLGVLIALAIPDDRRDSVMEIADGIGEAARAAGTVVRGGNISAADELSITTTVLGSAFAPLERRGARAGDGVYVTGLLGGPGAALALARDGKAMAAHRARFAHPSARLIEARWLAEHGATAAIDISDGLAADLGHLAAASRVSIAIDSARIPCVDGVTADGALASGEEYELVVTAASSLDSALFARRFGIPLTRIGAIAAEPAGGVFVDGDRVARGAGHDHLSR